MILKTTVTYSDIRIMEDSIPALLESYDEKLVEYLENCSTSNTEELIDAINEFYMYEHMKSIDSLEQAFQNKYGTESEYEGRFGFEIEQIDELVEKYKYLIVTNNCCSDKTDNYCPKCGRKLK